MDGKICDEKEQEIIIVALSDFRIRNLTYKLYEDDEIRSLIKKMLKEHKEEIEVIE